MKAIRESSIHLRTVLAAAACLFAAAALAVSLTHAGPRGLQGARGPQGPQGETGRDAEVAHLGVCVVATPDNMTGDMSFVNVTSPQLIDDVPSCPVGQFVSIVPQTGQQ